MMASLSSGARTDKRRDVSWSVFDNTNFVILTKVLERQVASSSAVEDPFAATYRLSQEREAPRIGAPIDTSLRHMWKMTEQSFDEYP
jgi:hypothetical protein